MEQKQFKNWSNFDHCHKFWSNFNSWDTHRKWLFSLIVIVKLPLIVIKGHNFLKRKFLRNTQELVIPKNFFLKLRLFTATKVTLKTTVKVNSRFLFVFKLLKFHENFWQLKKWFSFFHSHFFLSNTVQMLLKKF